MPESIRDRLAREIRDLTDSTQQVIGQAETDERDLTDDEWTSVRESRSRLDDMTARLAELDEWAAQRAAAAEAARELDQTPSTEERSTATEPARAPAVVRSEPGVYARRNGGPSYFRDLIAMTLPQANIGGADAARDRLDRYGNEVRAEQRDLTRTDGAGGYFVPPAWLMDEFLALARAGRATADLCNGMPLPGGTDSINIPKVATGTATAVQTADNAAVQETDLSDAAISVPVRTIAGQQDLAIQLIDQSPLNFDEIVLADLAADYATKLDVQVLNGSGSSGQATGILNTGSITSVTYTDASPTVPEAYPKIADAVQQIHTTRFLPPSVIVMHPRRWAWFLAALDASNRPLVVPAGTAYNPVGTLDGVDSQRIVGQLHGLPVVTDPNIPTNLGGGTNEDRVFVLRAQDLYLWESDVRSRVLPEVLSGNLTVRLQVYGYFAFTAARYPASIAVLSGTGLAAPTF